MHLYSILLLAFFSIGSNGSSNLELADQLLSSLEKAVYFVSQEYENLNIDGVFAFSLAEGNLDYLLEELDEFPNQQKRVEGIVKDMKLIRKLVNPLLPQEPYKYYVFKYLLADPEIWKKPIEWVNGELDLNPEVYNGSYDVSNKTKFYWYLHDSTFSESISDSCLVEVVAATNDTKPHTCPSSKTCKDYMLTDVKEYNSNYQGYGVTHRLLYLQSGRARNCIIHKKQYKTYVTKYCSYIYWEAERIYGFQIDAMQDLLLEQIALCGMEGFAEFVQKKYILYTLEKQQPEGCYEDNPKRKRIQRETKSMSHGCNSHTTGLGVSVLSLTLRSLFEVSVE